MTGYLVYNALTGASAWIEADTPSRAVIKAEALRSGTPEQGLKAGRDERSDVDVWCGESSILGTRRSVTRG